MGVAAEICSTGVLSTLGNFRGYFGRMRQGEWVVLLDPGWWRGYAEKVKVDFVAYVLAYEGCFAKGQGAHVAVVDFWTGFGVVGRVEGMVGGYLVA